MGSLVSHLTPAENRLDGLACDDLSMRASLTAAVAMIRPRDEVAVRLLEVIGVDPDGAAVTERVAVRLGISGRRARRALQELIDAHLVDRDGSGGYRLAPLVREYVAELTVL